MPTTQAGVNSYQLHYTANSYQVSVNYTGLPADLTQTQATSTGTTGQAYQVSSPIIAGYTPDQASVMGTYGPVTAADGTFTVHYTADTKVYKVQAVDGNGNTITTLAPQQYDGKTGDVIDYPTYAGYTVSKNNEIVPAEAHPTPTIKVKYGQCVTFNGPIRRSTNRHHTSCANSEWRNGWYLSSNGTNHCWLHPR